MIWETTLPYAGGVLIAIQVLGLLFGGDDDNEEEEEKIDPRAFEKLGAVRQVKIYLEVHPLKCLDCNIEIQGPLTPPSGGCPKCGSSYFVVPTDDQDITKMVQDITRSVQPGTH